MKTNQNEAKRKNKKKQQPQNKELMMVAYLFTGLFIALMAYFAYFNFFEAETVINSSYNKRQDLFAERVVRGEILSSDGIVLAETEVDEDGTETRIYPYANMFAHVVGYASKGRSGLESTLNFNLLRSNAFFGERLVNEFKGEKNIGDNVTTTLDFDLQTAAYDALGDQDGAVVVMEADTGKILAMVSKPDYDPNDIDDIWDSLVASDNQDDSSLVNRATQGLYPPGSTFKMFTALEYIRENPDTYQDYTYVCDGNITIDGNTINCYHNEVHGSLDLFSSFAKSCNSSFANIGTSLNIDSLSKLCNTFLFNSELPTSMVYNKSNFDLTSNADTYDVMQTVIGQGTTLVTPLHMALITATIANDGVMMRPYLVDHIESYDGNLVKQYSAKEYDTLMTTEEAGIMKDLMQNVVETGTGRKLSGLSYTVAGKTGSAEYGTEKGNSHAWFVGFSPVEDSKIVVSVIVEGAGTGSEYAIPIAKSVFDAYYGE